MSAASRAHGGHDPRAARIVEGRMLVTDNVPLMGARPRARMMPRDAEEIGCPKRTREVTT